MGWYFEWPPEPRSQATYDQTLISRYEAEIHLTLKRSISATNTAKSSSKGYTYLSQLRAPPSEPFRNFPSRTHGARIEHQLRKRVADCCCLSVCNCLHIHIHQCDLLWRQPLRVLYREILRTLLPKGPSLTAGSRLYLHASGINLAPLKRANGRNLSVRAAESVIRIHAPMHRMNATI